MRPFPRAGHEPSDDQQTDRERLAETIAARMDRPLTALGVIFLLVVLADTTAGDRSGLRPWLDAATWLLWALFAAEFVLRAVIAPSTWRFVRRNWWQLVFLLLPFLRFLRVAGRLARLRPVRLGRLLSSAVRGVRTATRTLTSRIGWLGTVTAIVILSASQLLYEFAGYHSYAEALHDAALSAITGEGLPQESAVADVVELFLALYAVAVFAFLAGAVGAYLFERRPYEATDATRPDVSGAPPSGVSPGTPPPPAATDR